MILVDILGIVAIGITIASTNSILLIIGRFLSGIIVGLNSALSPMYINEISPTEMSGPLGVFPQLHVTFGLFIAFAMSLLLPTEYELKNS